ncbi:MAG: sugar phosphate isomerase/epimerase [Lachnospiraceae bacterium]|jgi:sugar phosphate isomerase/epimerase|nr:sugar phosphate isomerase/epimerase [Lachnospiraceae bacterium]
MKDKILISGFADEISSDFDAQLKTVTELGMQYISLRSADGKGIADYSVEEIRSLILPRLESAGVKVSSIGSPIGKVGIADEEGFARQLSQLDTLCQICKVLGCRYIRMFSFFIPEGEDPQNYRDSVLSKLQKFIDVAKKYDVILIHENEKEIYGDIGTRCLDLMESLADPCFKSAFDFANFVQCGEDTEKCWELLHEYVAYIHIKDAVSTDNENVVCGTGEGKIRELLTKAIKEEGYEGFLTLEPHLVLFDSLSSLETTAAENIIKTNKAKDGADGYTMQYRALCDILDTI